MAGFLTEVELIERWKRRKQPGAVTHKLMLRLEDAKALRDGSLQALKAKRARLSEVTLETPLGTVTVQNPHQHAAAIIALGQSEDHIKWYFDVHQRNVLERAVENLRAYQNGSARAENWSDSYIEFIGAAPEALARLADEKHKALEENRRRIQRSEPSVVATYATLEEARAAAKYYVEKFQPRLWYGWLNVHVIELPAE